MRIMPGPPVAIYALIVRRNIRYVGQTDNPQNLKSESSELFVDPLPVARIAPLLNFKICILIALHGMRLTQSPKITVD